MHLRLPAVGKTFSILKAMLCRYSAYFRGLLQLDLSLNPTNTIDLDDVSIEVMTSVLGWLYHDDLYFLHKNSKPLDFKDLAHIVDVYIFADKYDCVGIRNVCAFHFQDIIGNDTAQPKDFTEEIWHAFDKAFTRLPETAKFRQFLLSWLCFTLKRKGAHFDGTAFDRMTNSLPPFVVTEIARSFVQQHGDTDPTYAGRYDGDAAHWCESDDSPGISWSR